MSVKKKCFYITVNNGWECYALHSFQEKFDRPTAKIPIILCHGIATNSNFFDLKKEVSLIDYLIQHGYHVYNINLRGVGGSFCKEYKSSDTEFNFDDLLSDIRLIIDFILEYHKQISPKNNKVHWLGHSMGALLMYAFLSQEKSNKNLIKSFVSLGSPTELRHVGHPVLLDVMKLGPLTSFHLKIRKLSRFFAFPLSFFNTKYHNIVLNKYAVDRRVVAQYFKKGVGEVSPPLLRQFSDWITKDDMISSNRSVDYNDMGKNIEIPILLMSGSYDSFCPPHALLKTYLDIPLPLKKKEVVVLSKLSGFSFDYCHVGSIMGKKAREEIFPIISDWFDRIS